MQISWDYVVGVDTHLDEHVLAVVAAATGAVLEGQVVRAKERGYQAALRFAGEAAHGARAWAVEGTGSYGAGLARYLAGRGEMVLEVSRTPCAERRLRGKDDALDAARTARAALVSETLALPRNGERREALRLLLVARPSAVDVRREALGQLRGVIVTAPDRLREELRVLPTGRLLERCSRLRRSSTARPDELATRLVLRSLARRIDAATAEAAELEREILAHVQALAPQLLDEPGIGPIVAAQLIVAWSHRGRLRSEAAFARLAGVAPLPASSGQTIRHRRNEKTVAVGSEELIVWAPALGAERLWALEDCRGLTRWLERQLLAVGEELCGCLDADPLGRFSRQLDDVLIIERSPDGRLCEAPNVN